MNIVNAAQVSASSTQDHHYIAEASELRWPPGHIPQIVQTDIGNGQPFILQSADEAVFIYRQLCGLALLSVFND